MQTTAFSQTERTRSNRITSFLFLCTANGQLRSGYVYNWTSWLDDYGYGKCVDPAKCNIFPDGKPFPQSNDWRRKSYVYVWHTMGQYTDVRTGKHTQRN